MWPAPFYQDSTIQIYPVMVTEGTSRALKTSLKIDSGWSPHQRTVVYSGVTRLSCWMLSSAISSLTKGVGPTQTKHVLRLSFMGFRSLSEIIPKAEGCVTVTLITPKGCNDHMAMDCRPEEQICKSRVSIHSSTWNDHNTSHKIHI